VKYVWRKGFVKFGWEKRLKEKPGISSNPSGRKQGTRGGGKRD
jgi:hypothetical protein